MTFSRAAILAAFLSLPTFAVAHDSYIQLRFGEWTLVNGDGALEDDSYPADQVTNVAAHDASGAVAEVEKLARENYVAFAPAEGASALAATFVSGFWTKDTSDEWHNSPKGEVANPASSGEYLRHGVALIDHAEAYEPFGLPLEIIPASDPLELSAGDTLSVTVLLDGAPLEGAELGSALPGVETVTTDADGHAEVTVQEGQNVILTEHTGTHPKPDMADTLKHEATLSFAPHGGDDH